MKFREHKGSLADSMETLVELPDRAALIARLAALLRPYRFKVTDKIVKIELYTPRPDNRIGWARTYLITVKGYGVIGMADSDFPLEEKLSVHNHPNINAAGLASDVLHSLVKHSRGKMAGDKPLKHKDVLDLVAEFCEDMSRLLDFLAQQESIN